MKKYWKMIAAVAAFAVFMIVINVVYQNLSQEYKPQQNLVAQSTPEPSEEGEDAGETVIAGAADETAAEGADAGEEECSEETDAREIAQATADSSEEAAAESEEETSMMVDFTVENAAGEEVTLYSFLGKPIVLNFWASWCGPCKMELPDFQEAYEKYDGEIEFVMVNLTDGILETKEEAMEFIENEGYTLPFYFDTTQEAAYTYGISSVPMTFFINAEGEFVAYARGMIDAETLETGIDMIYP